MMALRRGVFALLCLLTLGGLTALLSYLLALDGFNPIEGVMVALFVLNMPWVVIGFWNASIGFILIYSQRNPVAAVAPWIGRLTDSEPITTRTAVVMPIYNEAPERVFTHLYATWESLKAAGLGAHCELFVLSDSDEPVIAAEEAERFQAWQAADACGERLHYRRRRHNTQHKVGNLWEFIDRRSGDFDHLVVLDADSAMTGGAIGRLIRLMQQHPGVGIIQTLVVGLPSVSPFARVFQFGMRHGMRAFTTGSAWWQGKDGPYWGHNAILRLAAFREHCRLPTLPGKPPLGGEVLSHDQVEAVLMRRAGYEVWVIPEEGESYEENPPTLPDFIKRDLRWCQGNMQYLRLLRLPGLKPMGRLQLLLAILMYTAAPCWYGFMVMGSLNAYLNGGAPLPSEGVALGVALFGCTLTMVFSPMLIGLADILLRPAVRAAYGGGVRVLRGMGLLLGFSIIMGPIMGLAQSVFIIGLFFGKRVRWGAQQRDTHQISWGEAARVLWPQTLMGLVMMAALAVIAPVGLLWGLPVWLGLLVAIPFAHWSSIRGFGRHLTRHGVCAIPEEYHPTPLIRQLRLEAVHLNATALSPGEAVVGHEAIAVAEEIASKGSSAS